MRYALPTGYKRFHCVFSLVILGKYWLKLIMIGMDRN